MAELKCHDGHGQCLVLCLIATLFTMHKALFSLQPATLGRAIIWAHQLVLARAWQHILGTLPINYICKESVKIASMDGHIWECITKNILLRNIFNTLGILGKMSDFSCKMSHFLRFVIEMLSYNPHEITYYLHQWIFTSMHDQWRLIFQDGRPVAYQSQQYAPVYPHQLCIFVTYRTCFSAWLYSLVHSLN